MRFKDLVVKKTQGLENQQTNSLFMKNNDLFMGHWFLLASVSVPCYRASLSLSLSLSLSISLPSPSLPLSLALLCLFLSPSPLFSLSLPLSPYLSVSVSGTASPVPLPLYSFSFSLWNSLPVLLSLFTSRLSLPLCYIILGYISL